jgi:uncharacterized protein YdhG (YjbR/CyaY superfamily)
MVDEEVAAYIDAAAPDHRELLRRLHRLILTAHPEAAVALSYKMPSYKVGRRRLYLGAWQHGASVYGWRQDRDAGFSARHPALHTSKGTIRLRPADAAGIPDEEFLEFLRTALAD